MSLIYRCAKLQKLECFKQFDYGGLAIVVKRPHDYELC